MLVLLFGVTPSAAIASDLMAAFFMKPAGVVIHWRRKTVNTGVVRYPLLRISAGGVLRDLRDALAGPERARRAPTRDLARHGPHHWVGRDLSTARPSSRCRPRATNTVKVRPLPTIIIGVVGGFMVGLTSVGAGSLILVLLVMLYPTLSNKQLVGTDLAQSCHSRSPRRWHPHIRSCGTRTHEFDHHR